MDRGTLFFCAPEKINFVEKNLYHICTYDNYSASMKRHLASWPKTCQCQCRPLPRRWPSASASAARLVPGVSGFKHIKLHQDVLWKARRRPEEEKGPFFELEPAVYRTSPRGGTGSAPDREQGTPQSTGNHGSPQGAS